MINRKCRRLWTRAEDKHLEVGLGDLSPPPTVGSSVSPGLCRLVGARYSLGPRECPAMYTRTQTMPR